MKESLAGFYSEEDRKKLLSFRPAIEQHKPKVLSAPAAVVAQIVDVTPDQCEFAVVVPFPGCSGRLCWDKTFCPSTVFAVAKVFLNCRCRKNRLKELQKGQL